LKDLVGFCKWLTFPKDHQRFCSLKKTIIFEIFGRKRIHLSNLWEKQGESAFPGTGNDANDLATWASTARSKMLPDLPNDQI
jgi:hypothetical protein